MAPSLPKAIQALLAAQCLLATWAVDCTSRGKSYSPDLNGHGRTDEPSLEDCQRRCADTESCQFFTYWPDRGCHVHGADAQTHDAPWKWSKKEVISGPVDSVDCDQQGPVIVPKCPGKFGMEGMGTLELVPNGWHDSRAGGNSQAVEVDSAGTQVIKMDGRAYFAETCDAGNYSNEHYQALNLLGKRLRYTTNISGTGCGCNAAMYLVSMRQNTKPSACYDYYCDANDVCGVGCHEIDIQEANMFAWHSTLHAKSDHNGVGKGYGGGDGWDGPRDFGASQYSPGGECIDTDKPFEVEVAFPIDGKRQLQAMVVTLSQAGHDCQLTLNLNKYEGMGQLSGALEAGMTPVVSYWSASDMLWMDGAGEDGKGPCKKDDVKSCPSQIQFYDFKVEDIDSAALLEKVKQEEAEKAKLEEKASGDSAPDQVEEAPSEKQTDQTGPTSPEGQADQEATGSSDDGAKSSSDPPSCASTRTEDCRYSQCCKDAGMQCFEKDEYWATCQIKCEAGSVDKLDELMGQASPWSCKPLGSRTPGTADPQIVRKADKLALDLLQFDGSQTEDIVMKWGLQRRSNFGPGATRLGGLGWAATALLAAALAAATLAGLLAIGRRIGRRSAQALPYEGLDSSAQAEVESPSAEACFLSSRPFALGIEEHEAAYRLSMQHHPLDPLLEDQPEV